MTVNKRADADLFAQIRLGDLQLPNRIVMAPLTRNRAGVDNVPQAMNAQYYTQRASAGLIITEATQISAQGVGYPATPGIHSPAQVAGWRKVTDAVHANGGHIVLQLWHVGRISHPSLQPDSALPVAPSAIRPAGEAFTYEGLKPFVTPRALETNEIPDLVAQYAAAAYNAKTAGFDGVEIHAANGYLIDQFLRDGSNKRTDRYGGSLKNRVRFLLEVTEAVTKVWKSNRVGVRISPGGAFNDMFDSAPEQIFFYVAEQLNRFGLAYLHVVEGFESVAAFDFNHLPRTFLGSYMANAGYTFERASVALGEGLADLVSFGQLFIANPDLPQRFALGSSLNAPDPDTFYGGDARGYTDYPALANAA